MDILCGATGGPSFYMDRDMETVHTGLNITESDWQKEVKLLTATLEKFIVPQKENDDLYAAYLVLNRISWEDNFYYSPDLFK